MRCQFCGFRTTSRNYCDAPACRQKMIDHAIASTRQSKLVIELRRRTGLSVLKCRGSLKRHKWKIELATETLFTELQNRSHKQGA